MISKHVQEVLAVFNSATNITCSYKPHGKKPHGLVFNFTSLSPLNDYDPVFELSNGKTILSQDLEFANIKQNPVQTVVELGNYHFYCN